MLKKSRACALVVLVCFSFSSVVFGNGNFFLIDTCVEQLRNNTKDTSEAEKLVAKVIQNLSRTRGVGMPRHPDAVNGHLVSMSYSQAENGPPPSSQTQVPNQYYDAATPAITPLDDNEAILENVPTAEAIYHLQKIKWHQVGALVPLSKREDMLSMIGSLYQAHQGKPPNPQDITHITRHDNGAKRPHWLLRTANWIVKRTVLPIGLLLTFASILGGFKTATGTSILPGNHLEVLDFGGIVGLFTFFTWEFFTKKVDRAEDRYFIRTTTDLRPRIRHEYSLPYHLEDILQILEDHGKSNPRKTLQKNRSIVVGIRSTDNDFLFNLVFTRVSDTEDEPYRMVLMIREMP